MDGNKWPRILKLSAIPVSINTTVGSNNDTNQFLSHAPR